MGKKLTGDPDWEAIWRSGLEGDDLRLKGRDFEERAALWDRAMRAGGDGGYVEELLDSMNLSADMTVVDVGCGSGIVTVPMAKRVGRVTAVDSSRSMIDLARGYAAEAGVKNITFLNKDWLEMEIGRDVEPHDVALASRSLQTLELRRFLSILDRSAGKRCCICLGVGAREDDAEICTVLGVEYRPPPSHLVVLNLLGQLGILADVEIHSRPVTRWYRDLDEAVFALLRGRPLPENATARLKAHCEKRLTFSNGRYGRISRVPWALISWKKGDVLG